MIKYFFIIFFLFAGISSQEVYNQTIIGYTQEAQALRVNPVSKGVRPYTQPERYYNLNGIIHDKEFRQRLKRYMALISKGN